VDVTATMAWPSLPRGKHGKTTGITVEIGWIWWTLQDLELEQFIQVRL
jgi:hypothetical protein